MSKRRQQLFIYDIKESVDAILDYVSTMDFESFTNDRKTYSAVIREFEIIGEATQHLPEELLQKYNEISWRDLKDFRNLLIHEYFGVDFEIIWNVIQQDLPQLKRVINKIISDIDIEL